MKYALILLLLLVMASGAYAGNLIYAFTYEASMPAGDTKDFIDKMSPYGAGMEFRGFDNIPFPPGLSFSLSAHFNAFSEEVSYTAPVTLLRDEPPAVPYIGLGLGGYWIDIESEICGVKTDCSAWHFGLAPEGGVMIPVSPETLLMIAVRYNYAFDSNEPGQQFWTLALGVGYNP